MADNYCIITGNRTTGPQLWSAHRYDVDVIVGGVTLPMLNMTTRRNEPYASEEPPMTYFPAEVGSVHPVLMVGDEYHLRIEQPVALEPCPESGGGDSFPVATAQQPEVAAETPQPPEPAQEPAMPSAGPETVDLKLPADVLVLHHPGQHHVRAQVEAMDAVAWGAAVISVEHSLDGRNWEEMNTNYRFTSSTSKSITTQAIDTRGMPWTRLNVTTVNGSTKFVRWSLYAEGNES